MRRALTAPGAAQFGVIVLTTSAGIMDHEEARRKKVGGKVRRRHARLARAVTLPVGLSPAVSSTLGVWTCGCFCPTHTSCMWSLWSALW